MTEPTTDGVQPSTVDPAQRLGLLALLGLAAAVLSAAVVAVARSIDPVRLQVQNVDGVENLYGTSGAEYFWTGLGLVIGLASVAMVGTAAIARGIQLGVSRTNP